MPKPRRAMTPFSFRRALVIFSGFVVCTLSLLALCSNHGSPLSPANLLIEAKLAMRKYGGNNLRSLTGIQNRAPAALVVQQKDLALAKRSAGRTSETGEDGKGSESSKSGTETLLTKRNSSNGLSLMRRGANTISETGSAGAKTVTYSRSAEPVTLTRIPSKYSKAHLSPRYLYWGPEIDHPNAICSGFNHQAVSLVCALTEALATGRTFILPSHICIRGRHRGLLQLEKATRGESFSAEATKMQEGGSKSLERKKDKSDDVREGERSERQSVNEAVGASSHSWAELESLIDVGCVNRLVPIVLNTSLEFHGLLKPWESQGGTSVGRCFNLFSRELGLAENMRKTDPIDESLPQLKTLSKEASNESGLPDSDIRRTLGVRDGKNDTSGTVCVIHGRVKSADMAPWNASKLLVRTRPKGIHFPWFKVCKQGSYKKGIWYSKLFPKCFAEPLRKAALEMQATMGEYDAVHVRRGDKLTGLPSRQWPNLERDTSPSAIRARLSEWIPSGRSVYVASNEANQSFFEELRRDFKVSRPSDFSDILRPVIRNEYQLYIVEILVLRGATTFVATFKQDDMLGHNTSHYLAEDPSGGVPRGSKGSHV